MRTIRHTKTLFYHDGPQVIEAIDDDGQSFIGVMVEPDGVEERFILKAVAADRDSSCQSRKSKKKTPRVADRRGFCGQTLGDRPTADTAGS